MTELKYYNSADFRVMFIRGCLLPIVMVYVWGWIYGLTSYWLIF